MKISKFVFFILLPLTILNCTYVFRSIGLRFSPNGKSILLTTNGSLMRLLDAFNGHPLQTFAGHLNNKGIPVDGCFSPDSKVIYDDTLFKSSILVNSPYRPNSLKSYNFFVCSSFSLVRRMGAFMCGMPNLATKCVF